MRLIGGEGLHEGGRSALVVLSRVGVADNVAVEEPLAVADELVCVPVLKTLTTDPGSP